MSSHSSAAKARGVTRVVEAGLGSPPNELPSPFCRGARNETNVRWAQTGAQFGRAWRVAGVPRLLDGCWDPRTEVVCTPVTHKPLLPQSAAQRLHQTQNLTTQRRAADRQEALHEAFPL